MATSPFAFPKHETCLGVHSIERRVTSTGNGTGSSGRHCVDNPPVRKDHSGSTFRRFSGILLAVLAADVRSIDDSKGANRLFSEINLSDDHVCYQAACSSPVEIEVSQKVSDH